MKLCMHCKPTAARPSGGWHVVSGVRLSWLPPPPQRITAVLYLTVCSFGTWLNPSAGVLCLRAQASDSVEVAKAAPFVEKLVADGYEVLYLTEAIDEAVVTNLAKFGDHDLVDVSKEGLQLDAGEDATKKVGWLGTTACSVPGMAPGMG